MSDILERIVAGKREEVAAAKRAISPGDMARRCQDAEPARDFFGAMTVASQQVRVIAEIKRASPSAGMIRPNFDPVEIARAYATAGARAISCLTDKPYFQGDLAYLGQIKQHVALPVLRKDFMIDSYQIDEAREAGADAVLLIAECLEPQVLRDLADQAIEHGMAVLLEVYERRNLEWVVGDAQLQGRTPGVERPILFGVNNRNLRTMTTDLGHSLEVLDLVDDPNRFVSESGIRSHADVHRLQGAGVNSILVGEHLMRQPDVAAALRMLIG